MGAFGGLILTNKGRNLQAKAQTGIQLNFTRIGIGDGYLGTSSIVDLNALKHEIKSLDITKIKTLSDGKALLGTILSNQDIIEGFYFREIGVFAQDPDLGEILYCYGNSGDNAEYIPAGGGPDVVEKSIDIITIVGNAPNVTAKIDESLIFITPEEAQEMADQAESRAKEYADQQLASFEVPVKSVNNKTGDVILSAADVGAETPTGAQQKAEAAAGAALAAAKQYTDQEIAEVSQELDAHKADIVQTDEVNSSEKYPSSAVTYVHGQRISKIENDLKGFSVVLKNYILAKSTTYELSEYSSSAIFLIITHQDGVHSSLRSAHLVFCAIPGYNGSVVTLAPSSYIEVKYENDKILITNTYSTASCYLNIIKLF